MNVTEFRDQIGAHMCQYQSSHMKYPGDADVRNTTQKPKQRRGMDNQRLEKDENEQCRVSYAMYLYAKFPRGKETAMCNDKYKLLMEHLNSFNHCLTKEKCQMCGKITCTKCEKSD